MNTSTDGSQRESWCTIKQAAAHLGVSAAFLRKAVRDRKVPFARLGSKALRFRRADLDRWAEGTNAVMSVRTAAQMKPNGE